MVYQLLSAYTQNKTKQNKIKNWTAIWYLKTSTVLMCDHKNWKPYIWYFCKQNQKIVQGNQKIIDILKIKYKKKKVFCIFFWFLFTIFCDIFRLEKKKSRKMLFGGKSNEAVIGEPH